MNLELSLAIFCGAVGLDYLSRLLIETGIQDWLIKKTDEKRARKGAKKEKGKADTISE